MQRVSAIPTAAAAGGADVYIAEPVQRSTLVSVINRLLGL
jgi:hypothetical protein